MVLYHQTRDKTYNFTIHPVDGTIDNMKDYGSMCVLTGMTKPYPDRTFTIH
jgi:hypothetical protein